MNCIILFLFRFERSKSFVLPWIRNEKKKSVAFQSAFPSEKFSSINLKWHPIWLHAIRSVKWLDTSIFTISTPETWRTECRKHLFIYSTIRRNPVLSPCSYYYYTHTKHEISIETNRKTNKSSSFNWNDRFCIHMWFCTQHIHKHLMRAIMSHAWIECRSCFVLLLIHCFDLIPFIVMKMSMYVFFCSIFALIIARRLRLLISIRISSLSLIHCCWLLS